MKESKQEVVIDFIFNLLALILLVAAMVQYFYTDHMYMSMAAAVATLVWTIVVIIKYSRS
jgi:hypothetical protein